MEFHGVGFRCFGAGSRFEFRDYAAFLQNAGFFSGWSPRVCTLGWDAMPCQGMGISNGMVLRLVMCVIGLDLTHASGSPLSVKSIQDER